MYYNARKEKKMKCCKCDKEIDTSKYIIPPDWFGMYNMGKLIKVICLDCIRKPENKEDWTK